MPTEEEKAEKLKLYTRIMGIPDPDKVDKKEVAETLGISVSTLSDMIGNMKNNPSIRKELKGLGYADDQLFDWIVKDVPLL